MNKTLRTFLIFLGGVAAIVLLCVLLSLGKKEDFHEKYAGVDLTVEVEGMERTGTYSGYLNAHSGVADGAAAIDVDLFNYTSDGVGEVEVYTGFEGASKALYTAAQSNVTWTVNVPADGFYNIYLEYYLTESHGVEAERAVYINGEVPFEDAQNISLSRIWTDGGEVRTDNGMNEVMIFSPVLEKYLREKYPSFKYNSSTCKEIKNKDDLNEELARDYQYVVLDYNLNGKWEFIDGLDHPEKLEVLVNTLCQPACKRRGEHYRWIAKQQKNILINRTLPADKKMPIDDWYCEYGEKNCVHTIQDYPTFISPDQIWNEYVPRGINNFKIEGRTANLFSLIDTYSFFMLKPEMAGYARLILLRNLEESHIITVNKPRPAKFEIPEGFEL